MQPRNVITTEYPVTVQTLSTIANLLFARDEPMKEEEQLKNYCMNHTSLRKSIGRPCHSTSFFVHKYTGHEMEVMDVQNMEVQKNEFGCN